MVLAYFNKNWHPQEIRCQWAKYLTNKLHHYQNGTNNRLESLNQKLKGVVTKYSALPTFFNQLMACVSSLNLEKDNRIVNSNCKVPTSSNRPEEYTIKYRNLLTNFAFSKVEHEIKEIENVKFQTVTPEFAIFVRGAQVELTYINKCDCSFFTIMCLPCKHIIALRKLNSLMRLCANRDGINNTRWFSSRKIAKEQPPA